MMKKITLLFAVVLMTGLVNQSMAQVKENAIKANIDLFKNEVLALSISEKKEDVEYSSGIEIDNEILHIGLDKAKSERV